MGQRQDRIAAITAQLVIDDHAIFRRIHCPVIVAPVMVSKALRPLEDFDYAVVGKRLTIHLAVEKDGPSYFLAGSDGFDRIILLDDLLGIGQRIEYFAGRSGDTNLFFYRQDAHRVFYIHAQTSLTLRRRCRLVRLPGITKARSLLST